MFASATPGVQRPLLVNSTDSGLKTAGCGQVRVDGDHSRVDGKDFHRACYHISCAVLFLRIKLWQQVCSRSGFAYRGEERASSPHEPATVPMIPLTLFTRIC
jgi:hypothetical protein